MSEGPQVADARPAPDGLRARIEALAASWENNRALQFSARYVRDLRALLAVVPAPTACTCTMLSGQTPWQPAEWEQADDCPVHPMAATQAPTEAPGSEWFGPLLACPEPGRDGFWSYQECPRGVVGVAAHRRLGLVHRLRAADRRHACEDVIHPAITTSHHKSVAVEDTTADLAPTEAGEGSEELTTAPLGIIARCTGARDCPSTVHVLGCYAGGPE